jgi:hypothetical protein
MIELVRLADGVHALETNLRVLPGFHLPLRSTLLSLAGGELMVISPLRMDDELAARVSALGRVTHLVSPNKFHHLFVGDAAARWPDAQVHLAPGLPQKLRKLGREVPPHRVLPEGIPPDVTAVVVEGVPALGETLFFHAASRTLVVTDLVFHVLGRTQGALTGLILRMVGAHQQLAQGLELRLLVRDREAARHSLERIMALDFTRLVMAHGAVVDVDAKERLRAALRYMLAAPPGRQLRA